MEKLRSKIIKMLYDENARLNQSIEHFADDVIAAIEEFEPRVMTNGDKIRAKYADENLAKERCDILSKGDCDYCPFNELGLDYCCDEDLRLKWLKQEAKK